MHNTRLADRGSVINLQDLLTVGCQPFGCNHQTIMQHPRVTRDTTFPAYGGVLYGDVVTYHRAVTHLCRVKPAVAANVCAVAYDAGLGEAGVTGYPGPGKHHAVFIVNPAIPVLGERVFILNPTAFSPAGHIVKILHGNNLS